MRKKESLRDLLERAQKGENFAAARLMTLVVKGDRNAKKMISKLPRFPKETFSIGVTGQGGVGKSTLISSIIGCFRKEDKTIGVVACDPVSISGGAVLGDRIRMGAHALDDKVFIRSLAQHKNFKAVTREVPYIVKIFGAMKKDVIIVETVGVGQGDLGFRDLVEILIYVSPAGIGDEIQLLKGGAIETADIIVVNQFDNPGKANATFTDLLNNFGNTKKIYIVNSLKGEGLPELVEGIKEVHGGLRTK